MESVPPVLRFAHRVSAVVLGSAVAACGGRGPPLMPSATIVALSLPRSDGTLVTVPDGAALSVLAFFSPTCQPCRHSLPALVAREPEFVRHGAVLRLIAVLAESESTESARAALADWGVERPFLVDRFGASARDAGVRSVPVDMLLDETGRVLRRLEAGEDATDLMEGVP